MTAPLAFIEAPAFWAPTLPGWPEARAAFRGEAASAAVPARRPAPELLPAAERRRAPDTVALALEVGRRSVEASGRAPAELLSVFTSAHGDLAISDYLCKTLVETPLLVSPTKFHNSVHNAASGYWGIATGCLQASTAVSAFEHSFAAGLLEALSQCAADAKPVLLVGYDIEATGALASTNDSRGLLAVALIVAPAPSPATVAAFAWSLGDAAAAPEAPAAARSVAASALVRNAMADALPFFEALATTHPRALALPLGAGLALRLERR